jgi:hypothetical protein
MHIRNEDFLRQFQAARSYSAPVPAPIPNASDRSQDSVSRQPGVFARCATDQLLETVMNKQELVDNNNQLDNISNRKGAPGSLGNTTTGTNDHSQPDRPLAGSADHRSHEDDIGRESNDAAGGYPRSPGGANELAADQKMDDDTGFSNTVNQVPPVDERARQAEQSNVGRRSDMTAD